MQSVPIVPKAPPGGWSGWRRWEYCPPYSHTMIEMWRPEWSGSEVADPARLHPAMGVYGLYWRPVADGGETVH